MVLLGYNCSLEEQIPAAYSGSMLMMNPISSKSANYFLKFENQRNFVKLDREHRRCGTVHSTNCDIQSLKQQNTKLLTEIYSVRNDRR